MSKEPAERIDPLRDMPGYIRVFQTYIGWRMYLVFFLILAASLAEGVGILLLLPLLGVLGEGLSGVEENRIGMLMQRFVEFLGLDGSLIGVLLLLFIFFMLKAVFLVCAHGYNAYLKADLSRSLKLRMLRQICQVRMPYYVSRDTGYFINVIGEQINRFVEAFAYTAVLGAKAVNALVYVLIAVLVAWQFGLMVIAIGVPILLAFRFLNIRVRELSRRQAHEYGVLQQLLIQVLQSFKYLISTAKDGALQTQAVSSASRLRRHQTMIGFADAFTFASKEPIVVSAVLLILAFQLVWLEAPIGPIVVSIVLLNRGLNAVVGLQREWQDVVGQLGSVEIVRDEFARLDRQKESDALASLSALSKQIELRNVRFSYADNTANVLDGISLTIPARTSVAFVGESGAGKSTVVDLLTLMLEPDAGEVIIDAVKGTDVNKASWRSQIGFVSQETVVFDDTIANNICLWEGNPAAEPDLRARIRKAAEQAHIADFIESLPDGYDTLVGDRGVRLSGGQRQRLFIARELFKRPSLLILDEATSALDSESERAIQTSIDALRGEITVVIVAHRLSTIRNVDRVFVLDKGRLVEEGEYAELRDQEGSRFGRLVAMQAL